MSPLKKIPQYHQISNECFNYFINFCFALLVCQNQDLNKVHILHLVANVPLFQSHLFLLLFLFYLFICFFVYGCIGSSLLCAGFVQLRRVGATLPCGAWASHCGGFSCCGVWTLGAWAQQLWLVAPERRLSSCGARVQLLCSMRDLAGPGFEPVSPALAGRFLTTVLPGKSQSHLFLKLLVQIFFFLELVLIISIFQENGHLSFQNHQHKAVHDIPMIFLSQNCLSFLFLALFVPLLFYF